MQIPEMVFNPNLSIHFPLTREDFLDQLQSQGHLPFNPLPSHEGRLSITIVRRWSHFFQSTSLSRGKTAGMPTLRTFEYLSIHFPLTREDNDSDAGMKLTYLSIHFPLTREDPGTLPGLNDYLLSIHFPLTREDRSAVLSAVPRRSFNPLPSHEGRRI